MPGGLKFHANDVGAVGWYSAITGHSRGSELTVINRLMRVFATSHKMMTVRHAVDSVLYITDWAWGGSEIVSVGQVRSDHMRAVLQQGKLCCAGCPELLVHAKQARTHAASLDAASQARIMRAGAYTCGSDAPCHCRSVLIGPFVHALRHSIVMLIHAHSSSSAEARNVYSFSPRAFFLRPLSSVGRA